MARFPAIAAILALSCVASADTASVLAGLASTDPIVRSEAEAELRVLAPDEKKFVADRIEGLSPVLALRAWRALYGETPNHAALLVRAIRSSGAGGQKVWAQRVAQLPSRRPLGCDADLPIDVRAALVRTLAGYGTWNAKSTKDPGPALELLHDKSPQVRWGLVNTLRDLQGEAVRRGLLQLCKDESYQVRRSALNAPEAHPKDARAFFDLVAPALADPSPLVRLDAVRLLSQPNDPRIPAALAACLDDPDRSTRRAAASELLQKRDRTTTTQAIIVLLSLEDETAQWGSGGSIWGIDPMVAVEVASQLDRIPARAVPTCLECLDRIARRARMPGPPIVPIPWRDVRITCEPYREEARELVDGHERSFGPVPASALWDELARGAWKPERWGLEGESHRWGREAGGFCPPSPTRIDVRDVKGRCLHAVSIAPRSPGEFELLVSEDGESFRSMGRFPLYVAAEDPRRNPSVPRGDQEQWFPLPAGTRAVRLALGSPGPRDPCGRGAPPSLAEIRLSAGTEDLISAWKAWAEHWRPWLEDGLSEVIRDVAVQVDGLSVNDAARSRLMSAREKHMGHPVLRVLVPEILAGAGLANEAKVELTQVVADFPEFPPARALMARVLVALKEFEAARPHADAAVEGDPADPDARLARAMIAREAGDHAAAEADLAVAVALRPRSAALRFEYGYELLGLGRLEEGVATYRELTALVPNHYLGFYNLACGLSRLGRRDEALWALRCAFWFGFKDAEFARKDPDLEGLRSDPCFEEILGSHPR